jgi:transcriptional regulator with XRE-family HTH domain
METSQSLRMQRSLRLSSSGQTAAQRAFALLGISQSAFVTKLGIEHRRSIARQSLSRYLKGERVERDLFCILCSALGLDVANVIGEPGQVDFELQNTPQTFEYVPRNRDDFYSYYARQLSNARDEIWLTSDGFNMQNFISAQYAQIMMQGMAQALKRGVNIHRFQMLKTMHLNWIPELKKLKQQFENHYFVYVNPLFDNIENFCVIDPGTPHTLTEAMFVAMEEPTEQYSVAGIATFIHGNELWSDQFLKRFQMMLEQENTVNLSLDSLDQLYDDLLRERTQKVERWRQAHHASTLEELARGSGIFDHEILSRFHQEFPS